MPGSTRLAPPAEFPAGWARWAALAVFALFVAVALGLGQLNLNGAAAPNAVAAGAAAVVAIGAGTLLVQRRRPVLLYAAVATGGIAVLGHGSSWNVGWFTVCLLACWCVLAGRRLEAVAYWAGTMLLFAAEWLWVRSDPGWGAWLAGVTLATAFSVLILRDSDLLRLLRRSQAGLAE
ncbi:MAG: hypothetical protein ACTHPS_18310, partial [Streptosporangiaceae bacterium]